MNDSVKKYFFLMIEECSSANQLEDCASQEEVRSFYESTQLIVAISNNFIEMEQVKSKEQSIELTPTILHWAPVELDQQYSKTFLLDEVRAEL